MQLLHFLFVCFSFLDLTCCDALTEVLMQTSDTKHVQLKSYASQLSTGPKFGVYDIHLAYQRHKFVHNNQHCAANLDTTLTIIQRYFIICFVCT